MSEKFAILCETVEGRQSFLHKGRLGALVNGWADQISLRPSPQGFPKEGLRDPDRHIRRSYVTLFYIQVDQQSQRSVPNLSQGYHPNILHQYSCQESLPQTREATIIGSGERSARECGLQEVSEYFYHQLLSDVVFLLSLTVIDK